MTNNELLHSSLLDILFDGRNKEYGAYALRKEYNNRMILSLVIGLSFLISILVWRLATGGEEVSTTVTKISPTICMIGDIEFQNKPKVIPTPSVSPARATPIATAEHQPFKIVPNELADLKPVNTQEDMLGKQIGNQESNGEEFTNQAGTNSTPVTGNTNTGEKEAIAAPVTPMIPNRNPEFPGGQEALSKWLSRNLNTPMDLESGDKKMVKARFKVDRDGSVSLVEIEVSGGDAFDREVIRVCKKMPKWRPAIQNGEAVPVSYVLPVTFIGVEQ